MSPEYKKIITEKTPVTGEHWTPTTVDFVLSLPDGTTKRLLESDGQPSLLKSRVLSKERYRELELYKTKAPEELSPDEVFVIAASLIIDSERVKVSKASHKIVTIEAEIREENKHGSLQESRAFDLELSRQMQTVLEPLGPDRGLTSICFVDPERFHPSPPCHAPKESEELLLLKLEERGEEGMTYQELVNFENRKDIDLGPGNDVMDAMFALRDMGKVTVDKKNKTVQIRH